MRSTCRARPTASAATHASTTMRTVSSGTGLQEDREAALEEDQREIDRADQKAHETQEPQLATRRVGAFGIGIAADQKGGHAHRGHGYRRGEHRRDMEDRDPPGVLAREADDRSRERQVHEPG